MWKFDPNNRNFFCTDQDVKRSDVIREDALFLRREYKNNNGGSRRGRSKSRNIYTFKSIGWGCIGIFLSNNPVKQS